VIYSSIGSALTISGAFPGGLTLTNQGHIVGGGGNGATGGSTPNGFFPNVSGDAPGTPGQPGLLAQTAVNLDNQGVIAGGGGGGGAGGGGYYNYPRQAGGGGGGRSGAVNSTGGARLGTDGTFTAPGAGGPLSGSAGHLFAGAGGAGGEWGALGQNGMPGGTITGATAPVPASGGGAAVVGNSNITWIATGARYGAIQ
jgi:hypothetical protein